MSSTLRTEMPDAEILQELGRRLQALRKGRRLSQAEVAELSGIARRTLYSAERGDNPTMLTVIRLLRTYGRLGSLDSSIQVPEVSPIDIIDRLEEKEQKERNRG